MAIWIKKLKNKKLYKLFAPQVHLIDIKNLFKDKSLEGAMRELGETARVYKGQPDLEKEGYYITEDDGLDSAEDNNVVGVLKEYFNNSFSNPNLLINSNFKNPVNQRFGKNDLTLETGNASYKFYIDRWKFSNRCDSDITLSNSNNILKITILNDSKALPNFNHFLSMVQSFEDDVIFKPHTVYTVSVRFKQSNGGMLRTGIHGGIYSNNVINTWQTLTFTGSYDNLGTFPYTWIDVVKPGTIELEYIKLEVGDKATPFVPRPYEEELALCQRYYEVSDKYEIGIGTSWFNEVTTMSKYKVTKRTPPTIKIFNQLGGKENYINTYGLEKEIPVKEVAGDAYGILSIRCNSEINNGQLYTFKYAVDAEIY